MISIIDLNIYQHYCTRHGFDLSLVVFTKEENKDGIEDIDVDCDELKKIKE